MPATSRILTALLIAFSGATVMVTLTWPVWRPDVPLILLAGGGAFLAGCLCASLFGRSGHIGIGFAVLGALLATTIGASLAGLVFVLQFENVLWGLMAVPAFVMISVLTHPPVSVVWVLTMSLTHAAALQLRK